MSVSFSAVVGPELGQRCEHPDPQVRERLRVGGQHQLPEVLLGVQGEAQGERAERPVDRRAHRQPGPGRPGDGTPVAQQPQQRRPAAPAGVRHQEQHPLLEAGQVLGGLQGVGGQRPEQRPDVRLGHDHRGQRLRRRPARTLGCGQHGLRRRRLQQVVREAFEQSLPHPPGRVQLVGVAGHAGRGQLVDVGEHQLREAGQGVGVDPVAHRRGRHLPPRDPGADPVRRQQRVDRPAAAGLAAAELVGALDRRRRRGAGVRAAAPRRQRDEAAERQLHGRPDVLADLPGQGPGVAGHLLDDGADRLLGHLREAGAHLLDGLRGEVQAVAGGAPGVGEGHIVRSEQM